MNIVVIGGTGFIGTHLINKLLGSSAVKKVSLISRREDVTFIDENNKLRLLVGNCLNISDLEKIIEKNSVVVNLVYLSTEGAEKNRRFIENLLMACKRCGARKLLHCSTAIVSGRSDVSQINEATKCNPFNDYEKTKLSLEDIILKDDDTYFDKIILRPTGVFGVDGQNLIKMAGDITRDNKFTNCMKSAFHGCRSMNVVSVKMVVEAIFFIATFKESLNKEIFIVAQDESADNNYKRIKEIMGTVLNPAQNQEQKISIPTYIVKAILSLLGRSNIDVNRRYDTSKLKSIGLSFESNLKEDLIEFANWYKKNR